MKIEGAIPRGQLAATHASEVGWASPPPNVHSDNDAHHACQEVPARRPALLRGALSSLRYQALQNAPIVRADTAPPGPNSSDSQLASELEKSFGELYTFLKGGRLTQSSLQQIAAQPVAGE
ncbi:hypothetical protein [Pseudomonas sp. B22129]|uniref:hypothetical protein n=1 Tax=Pseudomonas sp. B22129 TaxID=3235111 RepID=UPI003783349D